MGILYPSTIDNSKISKSELDVYMFLKNILPDNYYVFYDIRVNNLKPDFVIVSPELGVIILEVKAWSLNFIKSSNVNNFALNNGNLEKNPLEQAEYYRQNAIEYILGKEPKLLQTEGRYINKLKFPRTSGVIFTNIEKDAFLSSPHKDSIDPNFILFKNDIYNIKDTNILIKKLENMFVSRRTFLFDPFSEDDIELIKQTLYKPSVDMYDGESLYNNNYKISNNFNESVPISIKTGKFKKLMFFIIKLVRAYFILVLIVILILIPLFTSYLHENKINLLEIYLEQKNITTNSLQEEANMIFNVGINPVGKGTFILIKDGENYIVSKVFEEGSIINFYKDKKIVISEPNYNNNEFSIENDIIDLEVGNAYTKIYLNDEEYKFIKKFKYDFINNEIIE